MKTSVEGTDMGNTPMGLDLRGIVRLNRLVPLAVIVIFGFVVMAIFADQIAPFDPVKISNDSLSSPSRLHIFGTDDLGRDVLSGVIFGARSSLLVGVIVAVLSALIGTIVGSIAGFAGGLIDDLLMRVTELFLIPPRLFLALVIAALFGTSLLNLVLLLSATYWSTTARLVRGQVLSLKERPYVEASRAIGAGEARILVFTILPNALPIVITNMSLMIGGVILLEAALDFVGIGDPTRVSWGAMLHNGQHFMRDAWWIVAFPSAALAILVIAFNVLGDALNSVMDPKSRAKLLGESG